MKRLSLLYLTLFLCILLGIHEGQLALWKEGSPAPAAVLPCPVDMLPAADREVLKDGIPIRSREELARLLEDFVS